MYFCVAGTVRIVKATQLIEMLFKRYDFSKKVSSESTKVSLKFVAFSNKVLTHSVATQCLPLQPLPAKPKVSFVWTFKNDPSPVKLCLYVDQNVYAMNNCVHVI